MQTNKIKDFNLELIILSKVKVIDFGSFEFEKKTYFGNKSRSRKERKMVKL